VEADEAKHHLLVQWLREQGGATAAGVAVQSSDTKGYGLFIRQVFPLTLSSHWQIPVNKKTPCKDESISVALFC
jgi:hypothetical protein